ncbi:butyrophilin subfamily 1 member A1-like [Tautogolabrus adspersus]
MQSTLFLLTALLLPPLACNPGSSEDKVTTIRAFAGDPVILPCHVDVRDELPTIEWSKEGLGQNMVLLYRDGCETHEMKDPAYWYRTSLIMNKLKNGNISLRISNVQLSDAGKYTCKTIRKKVQRNVWIELIVDAVSEPKLSVIPTVDGGVTLQCEASCWSPTPEITFLDDRDNIISAGEPKSEPGPRGCINIKKRVTLQTATNRVSCRVHQPDMNQTRVTETFIPDGCLRSCTNTTIIAVFVTVILCGLGVCLVICCKRFLNCGNASSADGQKLSSGDTTRRNKEGYGHPGNQADEIGGTPTAVHLTNMEDLEQTLIVIDEMQSPDLSPESVNEAEGSDVLAPCASTQSCPSRFGDDVPLLPTASSASPSDGISVFRSKSLSVSSSCPIRARPKRRYTTSAVPANIPDTLLEE